MLLLSDMSWLIRISLLCCLFLSNTLAFSQERTGNGQSSKKSVTILLGNLDGVRSKDSKNQYLYSYQLGPGLKALIGKLERRDIEVKFVEHANALELKNALESSVDAVIWMSHSWTQGGLIGADDVVDGKIHRIPESTFKKFNSEKNGPIFFPVACYAKPKVLDFYSLPTSKVQYMRRNTEEACALDFENVFKYIDQNFEYFLDLLNLSQPVLAKVPEKIRAYFDGQTYIILSAPEVASEQKPQTTVLVGNSKGFERYQGEEGLNMDFSSQILISKGPSIYLYKQDRRGREPVWSPSDSEEWKTLSQVTEIPENLITALNNVDIDSTNTCDSKLRGKRNRRASASR